MIHDQFPTVAAPKPLNSRQKVFARELGFALADGRRNFEAEYLRAGYAPGPGARGNAARLAGDRRIWEVADQVAQEAIRLAGLHLAYLQAKGLELLHANVVHLHRRLSDVFDVDPESGRVTHKELSAEEEAKLIALTFPLSELKIGDMTVKVAEKRGVLETLLKTMPGALAAQRTALTDPSGEKSWNPLAELLTEIDGRTRGLPSPESPPG